MKSLLCLLPLTLFTVSCALQESHVPYTVAERVLYDEEKLKDPKDACAFGYKKTYFVTKTTANLILSDCLSEKQAEDVDKLSDASSEPDVAIIESLQK